MKKLRYFLQRCYRLTLSAERREEVVWNDLKKLHATAKWNSGVYEKEKHIETVFPLCDNKPTSFLYLVQDGNYHCGVTVLADFPSELTTDIFVLAAHFNNHLNYGTVTVNAVGQFIEYRFKIPLLLPLLYTGELYRVSIRHYELAKDIYAAFHRLVDEEEAPAIIIADLLKNVGKREVKKS
ncbi:MAG TPA: hypothetical protein VLC98_05465 [Phnomibacter sp.]|nr:hypothetical protein [Phnomibacter sp.]